jgi:hypothetical protein
MCMFNFRSKTKRNRKKETRIERSQVRQEPTQKRSNVKSATNFPPSTRERSATSQDGTAAADRDATSERQKLIENALEVHRTQSKLLDDIDDGLKERVRTLALKKFLGEEEPKS